MRIELMKAVDIKSITPEDLSGKTKGMDHELVKHIISAIQEGKANVAVKQRAELNDPELIERFKETSVFMFYQLIETTQKTKETLIKCHNEHIAQIIKDLDGVKRVKAISNIRQRTPIHLKTDTHAICDIIELAINEALTDTTYYRDMLINTLPPVKRLVERDKQHINNLKMYQEALDKFRTLDAHTLNSIRPDTAVEREILDYAKQHGVHSTMAFSAKLKEDIGYTFEHIRSEAKRITNQYERIRHIKNEQSEDPFDYSLKEMYVLGALLFTSYHLNLISKSLYSFQSSGELTAYTTHADVTYQLYASTKYIKRVKPTKTKDRPLRVSNNDSFGELILYALTEKNSRQWRTFITQLYTMLGIRGDVVWNTTLEKADIDVVAQLVTKWNELSDDRYHIDPEDHKTLFFIGMLIVAFERRQQRTDTEVHETIVRMDEKQETAFNNMLNKKDRQIEQLQQQLTAQSKGLSQMDSLKLKNEHLTEQLQWLEERISQEEASTQLMNDTDANADQIDSDAVINQLNQSDTCFLGGDINWQQALRHDLPNANFQLAEESNRSMKQVETARIVIYNTATMNHGSFYRFKNSLKKHASKPTVIYINSQASNKDITYQTIGQQLLEKGYDL